MARDAEQVWITGIGLVSSLGEGPDAHWRRLAETNDPSPVVDEERFAPYPVHPLAEIDFTQQIPKRSDFRQMEPWQRIGTHAAGQALADAKIGDDPELLAKTGLAIAAGNGERDPKADQKVLGEIGAAPDAEIYLNETLPRVLRPTLYLAQLSNLLAGNISIIHKATGSSRTFKGEETAGISAAEDAMRRIASGQGELFLVGGACNGERADLHLVFELGHKLWGDRFRPIWERRGVGGLVTGSVGAFLVLEARSHAEARGAKAYARLTDIRADRCSHNGDGQGQTAHRLLAALDGVEANGPLAILSGASGVEPALSEELKFFDHLRRDGREIAVRAYGTLLGHGVEAQFPAGLALAALALSKKRLYPPFDRSGVEDPWSEDLDRVLVTGWGHRCGEGLALLEAA